MFMSLTFLMMRHGDFWQKIWIIDNVKIKEPMTLVEASNGSSKVSCDNMSDKIILQHLFCPKISWYRYCYEMFDIKLYKFLLFWQKIFLLSSIFVHDYR